MNALMHSFILVLRMFTYIYSSNSIFWLCVLIFDFQNFTHDVIKKIIHEAQRNNKTTGSHPLPKFPTAFDRFSIKFEFRFNAKLSKINVDIPTKIIPKTINIIVTAIIINPFILSIVYTFIWRRYTDAMKHSDKQSVSESAKPKGLLGHWIRDMDWLAAELWVS